MRDRILLVGEDFGNSDARYHSDVYALTGASGRRLASLCGYQGPNAMLMFALDFERTNVVTLQPEWRDKELVRSSVGEIVQRMIGRRTILLGSRVAAAFDAEHLPVMEWTKAVLPNERTIDWSGALIARAPHPSGRSHWWNDPENVAAARRFWSGARAAA